MLARLGWAVICLIVWPLYYAALLARWLVPWPLRPLDRAWAADDKLWGALRNPPFAERLRS